MEPRIHYRPDIDGLRALAIPPVIFFHSGVPGFLLLGMLAFAAKKLKFV